jgi:hypothetical protein
MNMAINAEAEKGIALLSSPKLGSWEMTLRDPSVFGTLHSLE